MKNLKLDYCPKCGNGEMVSRDRTLVLCSCCLMRSSDKVDMIDRATYNWHGTILKIRKKYRLNQGEIAFFLKLSPTVLTYIKKEKRAMPIEALKIIKEKYSECIVFRG